MRSIPMRLVLALLVTIAMLPCAAQDKEGCQDSPLISRFPGSVLTKCADKPDDTGKFPMGSGKPDKLIEGEYHFLHYTYPKTASKAQVVRNLVTALKTAGYTFVYDSGSYGDSTSHMGGTWIFLAVSGDGNYELTIVKQTALAQEVVANAAALTSGINATGHAAVYGIHFDTGKADIKPDSDAALQEIVKMLQEDAKLKVYVVGHTDNVGGLAANMELSKQRAAAVVKALTTLGVAATRLAPYGDGPYAPVASNDAEEGRAQNRRVELVKQ